MVGMRVGDEDGLQAPQASAALTQRNLRALTAVDERQTSSRAHEGCRELADRQRDGPPGSQQAYVEQNYLQRKSSPPRMAGPAPNAITERP